MRKHYAVWGRDRTYHWLWIACLVAGYDAAKARYEQGKQFVKP